MLFDPILPSAGRALETAAAGSIAASQAMRPQHLLLFLALEVTAGCGEGEAEAVCLLHPLPLHPETGGSAWQGHCGGVAHPPWGLGVFEGCFKKDLNGTTEIELATSRLGETVWMYLMYLFLLFLEA